MKYVPTSALLAQMLIPPRPLPRCAEEPNGCKLWVWNVKGEPKSKYCWEHAQAHGENVHG